MGAVEGVKRGVRGGNFRELAGKGGRARVGPMERCAIDWGSSPDAHARSCAMASKEARESWWVVMKVGRRAISVEKATR